MNTKYLEKSIDIIWIIVAVCTILVIGIQIGMRVERARTLEIVKSGITK